MRRIGEEKAQPVRKVPCEVYSRPIGYLRPVLGWNIGKRQEWADRVPYKVGGQREGGVK